MPDPDPSGFGQQNCAMNILFEHSAPGATPGFCPEVPFAYSTSAFSPYPLAFPISGPHPSASPNSFRLFLCGLCAVPLGDLSVTSPSGPCGEHPFHPRKQGISRKKHLFLKDNKSPHHLPLRPSKPGHSSIPILAVLLILSKLRWRCPAEPSTCERVPVNQIPPLAFSSYPLALQSPRLFELSTRFLILNFDFLAAFCRPLGSHCSRFPP